jgi:G2/mitotic-specific cyclin 3/4
MRPRGSTRVRDENLAVVNLAGPGKTLHSRAKSTSTLSSMVKNGAGGIQVKPQRRAFQDLTNASRPSQDDFGFKYDALSLKQTLAPLKEVNDAVQPPSTTLLAPAQRNLTRVLPKATPAAPMSTVASAIPKHVVSEPASDLSHTRKITQKAITKKSTQIFRESSSLEGIDSAPASLQSRNTAPVHQILEAPREKTSIVAPIEQVSEPHSFSTDILDSVSQVLANANSINVYEKQLPSVPSIENVEKVQSRSSESEMYLPALEQLPPLPLDAHDDFQAPLSAIEAQEQAEEDDEHYYDAEPTARSFRSVGDNTTGGLTQVVEPRVTARVLRELEEANEYVKETRTEEDIEDEAWDTSMVAEYGDEIFAYMRVLEASSDILTHPTAAN